MTVSGPQHTVVLSADEVEFLDDGNEQLVELYDDLEDAPTETWSRKAVAAPASSDDSSWWKAARQGLRASDPSADTEKREARMSWWEAARLGLRASDDR